LENKINKQSAGHYTALGNINNNEKKDSNCCY